MPLIPQCLRLQWSGPLITIIKHQHPHLYFFKTYTRKTARNQLILGDLRPTVTSNSLAFTAPVQQNAVGSIGNSLFQQCQFRIRVSIGEVNGPRSRLSWPSQGLWYAQNSGTFSNFNYYFPLNILVQYRKYNKYLYRGVSTIPVIGTAPVSAWLR